MGLEEIQVEAFVTALQGLAAQNPCRRLWHITNNLITAGLETASCMNSTVASSGLYYTLAFSCRPHA